MAFTATSILKKPKNLDKFSEKIMTSPLKETSERVNSPLLQLPPDKIHSFVLFHLIIIINIQIMINFYKKITVLFQSVHCIAV